MKDKPERALGDVLGELIVAQGELLAAEKLEAREPLIYASRAAALRERVARLIAERDALWHGGKNHKNLKQ